MKNVIAVVAKLSTAIVAALLLTPLLSGASPSVSRISKVGVSPIGPQGHTGQAAKARDNYQFYTVDVAGSQYLQVFGINNSRVAAGCYNDAEGNGYSFLWSNGQVIPLVYPGSSATCTGDVNNRGLVFGNLGPSVDIQHAAVLKLATDAWTLLPDVPGKAANIGNRMNDHGIGVGTACNYDPSLGYYQDCLGWTWDGKAYSFTNIPGTSNPWEGPYAINDRGDQVGALEDDKGVHAYLLSPSGLTIIDVPGAIFTQGLDINNSGEIMLYGNSGPPDFKAQSGVWRKGVFAPLPGVPGAAFTEAYGLNDHGDYCGQWYDVDGNAHGFVAFRK